MEKSFYYSVEWSEVSYLKEALDAMEIPYVIEQDSDRLQLDAGHVAIVFPDLPVRVYGGVHELFGSQGRRYPE